MTLTQINKAGLDEIALDHVFTIGASGSSAYTFQGEGLNGTVNNPTLYLTRGKTYRFENGSGGHPIRIQSTSGASGTAYNTGVTNNAGSGTVIVEVQHDAPDVLYYQCTSHAAMNGILYITGALADGGVTTAKIADDAVTDAKLANSINSAIAANTAKTSNATHTGDVTGSTSLTIANGAVNTTKIADDAVTIAKLADDAVGTTQIADQAVTLAKLPHGTSSNDGKFLRANNGADPTFETVSAGPTIANQGDNRVITATGTTDALNAESGVTINGDSDLLVGRTTTIDTSERFGIKGPNGDHCTFGITTDGTTNLGIIAFNDNDANFRGQVRYSHSNDEMQFHAAGAERFSINQHIVKVNDGDIVIGTSGHGINFDTAGSGSDQLLDDYEEGSFTPTAFGWSSTGTNSYGTQAGRYIKIGNLVTVFFHVEWSNLSNASGVLAIGGFPFTHRTTNYYGSTAVQCRYLDYSGDTVYAVYGNGFGTSVLLYAQNDNGNHSYLPIDGAARVEGTISYLAG